MFLYVVLTMCIKLALTILRIPLAMLGACATLYLSATNGAKHDKELERKHGHSGFFWPIGN